MKARSPWKLSRSLPLAPLVLTGLAVLCGLSVVPSLGQLKPKGSAQAVPAAPPQVLPITAEWCLDPPEATGPATRGSEPACVSLEVPGTDRQYAMGLQMRPPLPPLRGMWFPYSPPSLARFWMHRTPAPLDMLFVRDGRVIRIEARVPPCMNLPCRSYGPDSPVEGVLELGAGEAQRLGIAVGTPMRVRLINSDSPSIRTRD